MTFELRTYVDAGGRSAFERWFDRLEAQAASKVTIALARLEQGNVSNVKAVGEGVSELRIHWGPGYRVYFGQDGARLVILLCGGSKQRQAKDIAGAKALWSAYRAAKKAEKR
jgi:putative addiction module killer protein